MTAKISAENSEHKLSTGQQRRAIVYSYKEARCLIGKTDENDESMCLKCIGQGHEKLNILICFSVGQFSVVNSHNSYCQSGESL